MLRVVLNHLRLISQPICVQDLTPPLEAEIIKPLHALFRQLPRAIFLELFSECLTSAQN